MNTERPAATAVLVTVYGLLSAATLALLVTATGEPVTVWRVLAYSLLPAFVVWATRRLGVIWASVPVAAYALVGALIATDALAGVDPWYRPPLLAYTALLVALHASLRTARVVQARTQAADTRA